MLRRRLTDDLWLELPRLYHAADLYAAIDSDRQRLRTYLPWVDRTTSEADSREFIEKSLRRLAEKLTDRFADLVIYGMLAREWAALRAAER